MWQLFIYHWQIYILWKWCDISWWQSLTHTHTLILFVCFWRRIECVEIIHSSIFFQFENLINTWIHTLQTYCILLYWNKINTFFIGHIFFFVLRKHFYLIFFLYLYASYCRNFIIQIKTDTHCTIHLNGFQWWQSGFFHCYSFSSSSFIYFVFLLLKQIFLEKKNQVMCANLKQIKSK